jgi:hypothetical protein
MSEKGVVWKGFLFRFCLPVVGKIIEQGLWWELCDIKRVFQQL